MQDIERDFLFRVDQRHNLELKCNAFELNVGGDGSVINIRHIVNYICKGIDRHRNLLTRRDDCFLIIARENNWSVDHAKSTGGFENMDDGLE